jgi:FSR family fosmidomycin resistance protein-like MFS transporter
MARGEERPGNGAWPGVLAMALGHLSVDACVGIWPVYKVLARLDLPTAGGIATAATLAGNGLQLAFGPMADRGHRRWLVALGVAAAGAVCLLPYAATPAVLLALMVLASAGSAAFHPSGAGYVGAARTGRAGLAVALFLAGGYLGAAGSQLVYAGAFRVLDGRLAPLLGLPLVLGAGFVLVGRSPPGAAREGGRLAGPRAGSGVPLSSLPWGKLSTLFAIQALSASIGVAVQFLTPELFGGPGTTLGMGGAHALATLAGGAALVPAGAARDRFGARRVLFAANVLAGVSLGLLALVGARGLGVALGLVLAFTAANAVNTVVALAEGTRGLSRTGSSVSALLMGLPWLASAPAPSLAAFLADPSRGGAPGLALAFIGLCCPVAAAVALLLPAGEPASEHGER